MSDPQLLVASSLTSRRLEPQPGCRFDDVCRWATRRVVDAWRFEPRMLALRAEFGSWAALRRLLGRFVGWVMEAAAREFERGGGEFRRRVWSRIRAQARGEFGKAWLENEHVDAFLKSLLIWLFDLLIAWITAQVPAIGAGAVAATMVRAILESAT